MKSNFAFLPEYSENAVQLKKFTNPIVEEVSTVSLENWYEQIEMFEIMEVCTFDFPNFPETDKVFKLVYFKLNTVDIIQKRLFNGLIRLGQPEGVILEYHKEIDTYTLKFYAHQELSASHYVNNLQEEMEKDLRFRRVLAAVITQQESFENSQRLLVKELFG